MMVELKSLHKRFGKRVALDNLSLQVERGHIYGLLGHNGAGKSTTIGLLLGHLVPDAGEAWINGIRVQENRSRAIARTGAIFEAPAFYNYLSGYRNLVIFSQYSGYSSPERIQQVVHLVGLDERIDEPVRRYSHGMRQRLALAQALLPEPELLILDEPTDGLDPEGIHEMRQLVRRLNRELGLTIVLSSHLLGEVERLCHGVGILYEGHLLFNGDWHSQIRSGIMRLYSAIPAEAAKILLEQQLVESTQIHSATEGALGPSLTFQLAGTTTAAEISAALAAHNIALSGLEAELTSLEDFYLKTLRQWREERKG